MKVEDASDSVLVVWLSAGTEIVSLASEGGNMLAYPIAELPVVKAAGRGITAMKLNEGDTVFAFELARTPAEGALVKTPQGREEIARLTKFGGKRGDKGGVVIKRGGFVEWVRTPQLIVPPSQEGT